MNDDISPLGDIGFGYMARAAYACDPARSRGRLHGEAESRTRTPFQRDRDRIVHSTAFRRLNHKTQVFIAHEGDHYRTRLTHSIEVAQIARALARALRCDEDLAEAIALVHDFGHPPFGHAGERALDEAMAPWGGFDHNAQSLQVVTRLERRYAQFDGLNLCWETLEGLVKHNGPLIPADGKAARDTVAQSILELDRMFSLELGSYASIEAQAAAIADDIAYDTHDIDDGLRAGLLTLEMLDSVPLAARILTEVRESHPGLDDVRTAHEFMRRQITAMVENVVGESGRRLRELNPRSVEAVRGADRPMVSFSSSMRQQERALKEFLTDNLYRHERVVSVMARARQVVHDLFDAYLDDPSALPADWQAACKGVEPARAARHVCDFMAGMTDTYALKEHGRLFDRRAELG